MNTQMLKYLIYGVVGLLSVIIIIYLILQKNNKEKRYINSLQQGTKKSKFSSEIMYQKLYLFYLKTPFIKRYILKLRRRLEIVNIDDEYLTRLQASKILTRTFLIVIPIDRKSVV